MTQTTTQPDPVRTSQCPHCGGEGGYTTTDWVPYGGGNVPMPGYETCEHCSPDILVDAQNRVRNLFDFEYQICDTEVRISMWEVTDCDDCFTEPRLDINATGLSGDDLRKIADALDGGA